MRTFFRWTLTFFAGSVAGALLVVALMASGVLDKLLNRERPAPGEWGRFGGTPKAELLDEGRALKLLEDFVYLDRQGKAWVARKESIVDGASIPQPFWTLTGG